MNSEYQTPHPDPHICVITLDTIFFNELSINWRFITVSVLFLKYLKCMLAHLGYDLIKQQLHFLQLENLISIV